MVAKVSFMLVAMSGRAAGGGQACPSHGRLGAKHGSSFETGAVGARLEDRSTGDRRQPKFTDVTPPVDDGSKQSYGNSSVMWRPPCLRRRLTTAGHRTEGFVLFFRPKVVSDISPMTEQDRVAFHSVKMAYTLPHLSGKSK